MIFRIEWWVASVADERPSVDRVNTALQEALSTAGIEMPYPTHNLNLQVEPQTVDRLSQAWGEHRT